MELQWLLQEAKGEVPEYLLNEGKSEVSVSGLLLYGPRCGAATRPKARACRSEALSQSDVPNTTIDVGRRFVA
jgi:hypothetical protein